jgi:hypothetical protein
MGFCISINTIDKELRPASEMRARLNDEALKDYAEIFDALPPVKLVYDPIAKMHWVQDGYHRLSVATELGKTEVKAEITTGDYLDCWKLASKENGSHGVRLTNADKRARVERALRHGVMSRMSHRQVAEMCGVSSKFVDNMSREITEQPSCPDSQMQTACTSDDNSQVRTVRTSDGKRVGKDGKLYPATQPSQKAPMPVGEIPHVATPQVQTVGNCDAPKIGEDGKLYLATTEPPKPETENKAAASGPGQDEDQAAIEQEMRQHEAWIDDLAKFVGGDRSDPRRQARKALSMEWHRRELALKYEFTKKWNELAG